MSNKNFELSESNKKINKEYNANEGSYKTSAPIVNNRMMNRLYASKKDILELKNLLLKTNNDTYDAYKDYIERCEKIYDMYDNIYDDIKNINKKFENTISKTKSVVEEDPDIQIDNNSNGWNESDQPNNNHFAIMISDKADISKIDHLTFYIKNAIKFGFYYKSTNIMNCDIYKKTANNEYVLEDRLSISDQIQYTQYDINLDKNDEYKIELYPQNISEESKIYIDDVYINKYINIQNFITDSNYLYGSKEIILHIAEDLQDKYQTNFQSNDFIIDESINNKNILFTLKFADNSENTGYYKDNINGYYNNGYKSPIRVISFSDLCTGINFFYKTDNNDGYVYLYIDGKYIRKLNNYNWDEYKKQNLEYSEHKFTIILYHKYPWISSQICIDNIRTYQENNELKNDYINRDIIDNKCYVPCADIPEISEYYNDRINPFYNRGDIPIKIVSFDDLCTGINFFYKTNNGGYVYLYINNEFYNRYEYDWHEEQIRYLDYDNYNFTFILYTESDNSYSCIDNIKTYNNENDLKDEYITEIKLNSNKKIIYENVFNKISLIYDNKISETGKILIYDNEDIIYQSDPNEYFKPNDFSLNLQQCTKNISKFGSKYGSFTTKSIYDSRVIFNNVTSKKIHFKFRNDFRYCDCYIYEFYDGQYYQIYSQYKDDYISGWLDVNVLLNNGCENHKFFIRITGIGTIIDDIQFDSDLDLRDSTKNFIKIFDDSEIHKITIEYQETENNNFINIYRIDNGNIEFNNVYIADNEIIKNDNFEIDEDKNTIHFNKYLTSNKENIIDLNSSTFIEDEEKEKWEEKEIEVIKTHNILKTLDIDILEFENESETTIDVNNEYKEEEDIIKAKEKEIINKK